MHLRLFAANPTHKANAAANSVDAHVSGHAMATVQDQTDNDKTNDSNKIL